MLESDNSIIEHYKSLVIKYRKENSRLRKENEILEHALEELGWFVQKKLEYCAADFVDEEIDRDVNFECHFTYNPEEGNMTCHSNCWAEAFRNQSEKYIKEEEQMESGN